MGWYRTVVNVLGFGARAKAKPVKQDLEKPMVDLPTVAVPDLEIREDPWTLEVHPATGQPVSAPLDIVTDFEESAPGDFRIDPKLLRGLRPHLPPDMFGAYLDKYPADKLETYLGGWKIPLVIVAAVVAYLILSEGQ